MGLGRVELPTSRLSGVRSNHLSYRPLPDGRNLILTNGNLNRRLSRTISAEKQHASDAQAGLSRWFVILRRQLWVYILTAR